jgi:thiol-disulfide isomerase/thioredoxin
MFLEPGKADIRITDSTLNKVSVMGNPTNIEYEKYNQSVSDDSLNTEYSNSRDDYYRYRTIKDYDTALAAAKSTKMDSLRLLVQKRDLALCLTWIKQHPKSLINTSILYDQLLYLVPYISEDELKAVYHTLPTDITGNVWGKELRYKIDSLFIGGTAPNFSQPDTSGNQQSLTNFRGKYVLIDFWASWCVPCREENPTLIKVMEKFRDENFTIIGVSVDDKKVDWIKAIKQDRLHWIQLSSLDGRQNPVAIKYYANSYPYNYLVDPQGKIVAKNLRGDELVAKLNCLFK